MLDPPLVHFVHYVRNMKVNEKTARRNSGNAARSLRSLRSDGVAPRRVRARLQCVSTSLERSERSEREGGKAALSGENLVHCQQSEVVNGSERAGLEVGS